MHDITVRQMDLSFPDDIEPVCVEGQPEESYGILGLYSLCSQSEARERARAQLMLALYRSGRQAEALDVYREGRVALVEELGLEPGRALQELERSILTHDSALEPPARRSPAARLRPSRRSGLFRRGRQGERRCNLFCDRGDRASHRAAPA